jgi:hypothetical protein
MFLRCKIGRYAGEIREFAPQVGLGMLAAGTAENPYLPKAADMPPLAEKSAPVPARGVRRRSRQPLLIQDEPHAD